MAICLRKSGTCQAWMRSMQHHHCILHNDFMIHQRTGFRVNILYLQQFWHLQEMLMHHWDVDTNWQFARLLLQECTSMFLERTLTGWSWWSTLKTASTAKPATSKTTARTLTGCVLKMVEDRHMTACKHLITKKTESFYTKQAKLHSSCLKFQWATICHGAFKKPPVY